MVDDKHWDGLLSRFEFESKLVGERGKERWAVGVRGCPDLSEAPLAETQIKVVDSGQTGFVHNLSLCLLREKFDQHTHRRLPEGHGIAIDFNAEMRFR